MLCVQSMYHYVSYYDVMRIVWLHLVRSQNALFKSAERNNTHHHVSYCVLVIRRWLDIHDEKSPSNFSHKLYCRTMNTRYMHSQFHQKPCWTSVERSATSRYSTEISPRYIGRLEYSLGEAFFYISMNYHFRRVVFALFRVSLRGRYMFCIVATTVIFIETYHSSNKRVR